MRPTLVLLVSLQVALTSLATLVAGLRGSARDLITGTLSLLALVIAGAAIYLHRWYGVGGVLAGLVISRLLLGVAESTAARLMTRGGGSFPGRPPRELQRISQTLGRSRPIKTAADLFGPEAAKEVAAKQAAMAELIRLSRSRPETREIVQASGLTDADIEDRLKRLVSAGAGQWVNGHFVAASALYYPAALKLTLSDWTGDGDATALTAHRLIGHFERGATLE